VLRVHPLNNPQQQETVTVHQTKVFAGATMAFTGAWTLDRKYGRQFKATTAIEKKPATAASLEKYLGSGLIKGVGSKTARKIVNYFKQATLDIFESHIHRLTEVPGIASKKLKMIEAAWTAHKAIREVMMFLQHHGISTLFAVKIYQKYKDAAIQIVTDNPYQLANDFYGIGFFSADKVALSLGLAPDSPQRISAAIKHLLAASREQGHCYLTFSQLKSGLLDLINLKLELTHLASMEQAQQLKTRILKKDGETAIGYYSKTLFYDEQTVAKRILAMQGTTAVDTTGIAAWMARYCEHQSISLSEEQATAVTQIVQHRFLILTGGPGCGKTTTTLVLVRLLEALKKNVLLAAPTGRATQRMTEVIGREAKTIHRLLEWKNGDFKMNEDYPLKADFLIVDECSMLDISLSASLLKAVPVQCRVLFIGDADQLPSVGAGNVLKDLIASGRVPCFKLTQVFRQAQASSIIKFAHEMNQSKIPSIPSPFHKPEFWQSQDCLFIDSEEATQDQLRFIAKVKYQLHWKRPEATEEELLTFRTEETISSSYEQDFIIPDKYKHVNLKKLHQTKSEHEALKVVLKKIHPWSSLHYGLTAIDVIVELYLNWMPKYQGKTEIQILTPMTRGSLGAANLNKVIQENANPFSVHKNQLTIGERLFREGDSDSST
jgi:exodeoxyribonuclease V alpha subunit